MAPTRWKDLVRLTPWQRLVQVTLPVPWLALSLACFWAGAWPAGLGCSFYVFLTGLRLSHDAQHRSLGLDRWGHDVVLAVLSVVMGASMHAVQTTHLHHHRHQLDERDVEGAVARLPFPRVLLAGPGFIFDLHRFALRHGTAAQRRWVGAELGAIALLWPVAALGVGRVVVAHELAMLLGESLTAFFAVWLVHRGAAHLPTKSRTERSALVNALTYDMLLHADHHAYPAVPTLHWPQLAARRSASGERIEDDVVRAR